MTGSGIGCYKGEFFSFENFSTFSTIPLIRYQHENIVSALHLHDKIKANEVYPSYPRIKRPLLRI